MKLASVHIHGFKRFAEVTITEVPEAAQLVLLVGPNGSGKTSFFEALNFWVSSHFGNNLFDPKYHLRPDDKSDWGEILKKITPVFHNHPTATLNKSQLVKAFYFRTAYRHEPDFSVNELRQSEDLLDYNVIIPKLLIQRESHVSDNYSRIVSESIEALYDPDAGDRTATQITQGLVGRVREGMLRVFGDLHLNGLGRPMQRGSFLFTKGASKGTSTRICREVRRRRSTCSWISL